MPNPGPAKRLVITVSESDRWHGRSVYDALVDLLKQKGVASVTVTRGIAGYRGGEAVHKSGVFALSEGLPVRIEAVDVPEIINGVLPDVYDIVEHGVVEIQDSQIVKFVAFKDAKASPKGEKPMKLIGKAKMLMIHIGEADKWQGEPLYEALVKRARQLDLAGASVYRGIEGYGAHKRIHKHHTMTLSHDDPIMLTIVDTKEKINALLTSIDDMIPGGCLIAITDVTVVKYEEHAVPDPSSVTAAKPDTKQGNKP
jgi:PII-like signaling protein